jgi:hypothetical protein
MELDEKENIISFGNATNMETALKNTKQSIVQLDSSQYELLSACRGNIKEGIFKLKGIQSKLNDIKFNKQMGYNGEKNE